MRLADSPLLYSLALRRGYAPQEFLRGLDMRVKTIISGKRAAPTAATRDRAFALARMLIMGNEGVENIMGLAVALLLAETRRHEGISPGEKAARELLRDGLCLAWLDNGLMAAGAGHVRGWPPEWRGFCASFAEKTGFMPAALDIRQAFERWRTRARAKDMAKPGEIAAILADMRRPRSPGLGRRMYEQLRAKTRQEKQKASSQ